MDIKHLCYFYLTFIACECILKEEENICFQTALKLGEIFMKKACFIILMLSLVFSFTVSRAENTKTDIFYVNDVAIESKLDLSNGIYQDGVFVESESEIDWCTRDMLIPLRKVFETLGAKVIWQEETKDVLIEYNNQTYLCTTFSPNPSFPTKYFYVDNLQTNESIFLTSMSFGGAYCMINNQTYLYADTAKRLFEAVGCKVECEYDTRTFKITSDSLPK